MSDKQISKHVFTFNEHDNGGESLTLKTNTIWNGDRDGIYLNQELSLQSYCNSASFNLWGATITPESLRKLADELENLINESKEIANNMIETLKCSCGKLAHNMDSVQIYDDIFAGPICPECQSRLRQLSEKKVNRAK